jgi:hypothetical protein
MLFISIAGLLCIVSCVTERWVSLYPVEPERYKENGIEFRLKSSVTTWTNDSGTHYIYNTANIRFGTWVESKTDRYQASGFSFRLECAEDIVEEGWLEALTLVIEELGVVITKDENKKLEFEPYIDYETKKVEHYYAMPYTKNYIYAYEIRDAVNPKLSRVQVYNKFKKVEKVTIITDFRYTIDGVEYKSSITWNAVPTCRKMTSTLLSYFMGTYF